MKEQFTNENPSSLSPELLELDAELSRVGIRERASFGPELHAELARQWSERETESSTRHVGRLTAVAAAAVLFLGFVYSPARASLSRLIHAVRAQTQESVEVGQLQPALQPVATEVMLVALPEVIAESERTDTPPREGTTYLDAGNLTVFEPADFTFPRVVDPNSLQVLLQEHYPRHLQDARVGGKVRVRLWVDPHGAPSLVQVRASSGVPDLDQAAREAATQLVFEPARWLGYAVGTWVEFDVGFDPSVATA